MPRADQTGCFSLLDSRGAELIRLPAALKLISPLGNPDPYEWDHPPGSTIWYPMGDGVQAERPRVVLEGEVAHFTRQKALNAIEAVRYALARAASLGFEGKPVAHLDPVQRGAYEPAYGRDMTRVLHRLTLNTITSLTSADLGGITTSPVITNPGTTGSVVVEGITIQGVQTV